LVTGLKSQRNKLYHLGAKPVKRSTLSDANNRRPNRIYEQLFGALYQQMLSVPRTHGFRFKNPLYAFDTTTIDLCLELFTWARFRSTKAAIRLHTKLNLAGNLPAFVHLTDGKTHEAKVAKEHLKLSPGDIVVIDRGLTDYTLFRQIQEAGAFFVIRQKNNCAFKVVENRQLKHRIGLLADSIIRFTGYYKSQEYPYSLRRIKYQDPETQKVYYFLTNCLDLAPKTIAQVYKSRWQIELFFKWIKQHLKVKTFLGTSENAVKTQIWIAMCVYLLIFWIKHLSKSKFSMLDITRILQLNLFERRDLWEVLHPPDKPHVNLSQNNQLVLNLI
jgi:putative transposase